MKSDKLAYWLSQETLNIESYIKGPDRGKTNPDGEKLTLEDYMIIGQINAAISGNATNFKNIMDARYGIQQAGSGPEVSGTEENEIQVSFGTRED